MTFERLIPKSGMIDFQEWVNGLKRLPSNETSYYKYYLKVKKNEI